MGPVQSIVLRDTNEGFEPPLIRPGSSDGADDSIRYSIDGEIARGGMGSVFKGRDPDLGRPVAIKVLRSDLHNKPNMVRRFVEEAQIGGQLQHPGIVPIYEMGTFADRRPFFSMKLVKGHTLATLLEERKNPVTELPRFLGIFEQIAQTMAYVHARGVIHRDLKPSNVMVGAFGEVQVMDWGLAKVMPGGTTSDEPPLGGSVASVLHTVRSDSHDDASVSGTVLGTPSYMAPEQARGQMEWIDEHSDVFGLGSILCEILTGKPAFIGQSHREILMLTARGDLAETWKRLDTSGADQKLIELARHCLDPEPQKRPHHAGEVSTAITAYLTGVQDRVRSAELEKVKAEAMAVEERKRRKVSLALAASIVATVLIVGGGWAWISRQQQILASANALEVQEFLDKANAAQAVAEKSPPGDMSYWNKAMDFVHLAEVKLRGAHVESQLRDRVSKSLVAIQSGLLTAHELTEQEERDTKLLRKFAEIRTLNANKKDDEADFRDEGYREVFKNEGFDFVAHPTIDEGKLFASRKIKGEIAAALDDWAVAHLQERNGRDGSRRLLKIAQIMDPDPWRNQLRDALAQNKVGVLTELAGAVDLSSKEIPSLVLLGECLAGIDQLELAAKVLRDAQRRNPGDFWINYTLGTVLSKSFSKSLASQKVGTRQLEEAVRYLSNSVAVNPTSGLAHNNLAIVLRDAGRREESVAEFKEAVRWWPDYFVIKQNLASVLHSQRQELDSASALLRESIAADDQNPQLYFKLGDVCYDSFRYEDAIENFNHAIRLKPDFANAHTHLGRSLARIGRIDEAFSEQRLGVGLAPTNYVTHTYYGVTLRMAGQIEESVSHLREAIRFNPDAAPARHYLGNSLHDLGLIDEAIAEYQLSLFQWKYRWTRDGAWHDTLRALLSVGEFDRAEDIIKRAEARVSERVIVKHLRGSMLLARGEPAAALNLFEQVEKEKPEGYRALDALHEETQLAIRYEQLIGKLDEVVGGQDPILSPDDRVALADIALRRNRFPLAVQLFSQAFDEQPSLGEDARSGRRFAAARAAIRAGFDQGGELRVDSHNWLERGRSWLRAELDARSAMMRKNMPVQDQNFPDHNLLIKDLRTLIRHRDLASVREPSLMAKWGDAQRISWNAIWTDAEALLSEAISIRRYDKNKEILNLCKKAVRQFPTSESARVELAFVLQLQGDFEEAMTTLHEAARLTTVGQKAYILLAYKLFNVEKNEDAKKVILYAIKHNPSEKLLFASLEDILFKLFNSNEAIDVFENALALAPDDATSHLNLARAFLHGGDPESALVPLREAIRLDGNQAGDAIWALGKTQRKLGQYDQAIVTYEKICEIVRSSPDEFEKAKSEIGETNRLISLESRLNQILSQKIKLDAADEIYDLATFYYGAGRFAANTRFWREILAVDANSANDRKNSFRYDAACSAVLAGCGKEKNISEPDQARLRQQGLEWLKAELAAWVDHLNDGKPQTEIYVAQRLQHWRIDADLAGIRNHEALAKLPQHEQTEWQSLWHDVASLLRRAQNDGTSDQLNPVTDEQFSSKIPRSFRLWEENPPLLSGRRFWKRGNNEIFIGQDAHGAEYQSKILGRTTVEGIEGTVSERIGEKNLQYFVPDRGHEYAAVRYRRIENSGPWSELGVMEDIDGQP